jgi:hypothetical protein
VSPPPPLCCSYLTIADGSLSTLAESLKFMKKRHGILSYGYVYASQGKWRETELSQNIWTDLCKPVQELEVNMAKLSVMVSKFIIDVYGAKEEVNFGTYEKYLHALEEWSASLPQSLRYFPDHSKGAIHPSFSTEDEVASVSVSTTRCRQSDLSCPSIISRPSTSQLY